MINFFEWLDLWKSSTTTKNKNKTENNNKLKTLCKSFIIIDFDEQKMSKKKITGIAIIKLLYVETYTYTKEMKVYYNLVQKKKQK